jgi:hypothetical protein
MSTIRIIKRIVWSSTSALLLLGDVGCSLTPEESLNLTEVLSPRDLSPKVEAPPPPPKSPLVGTWKILHSYAPSKSAASRAEAEQWIGRMVTYENDAATFGAATCANADYSGRTLDRYQFFLEFHVKWTDIAGVLEDATIINVSCNGSQWRSPGGMLLITQKDFIVATWDGVFFQLGHN